MPTEHPQSEINDAVTELATLKIADQFQLNLGMAELRRDPATADREIAVYDENGTRVGTLDYAPENDPPVRVRVGKDIKLIGDKRYRLKLEDRTLLAELAQRPATTRAAEWRPTVALHPEASKRRESKEGDPVNEMRTFVKRVWGPDEARAMFTLDNGTAIASLSDQVAAQELRDALQTEVARELLAFFKKNPKEAKNWELVLEVNNLDNGVPFTISNLEFRMGEETGKRGLQHLLDEKDIEQYADYDFFDVWRLHNDQLKYTDRTWRLVRTTPLPGTTDRNAEQIKKMLNYYCTTNGLTALAAYLDSLPSNGMTSPVEAFYRATMKVRNGEQPSATSAEYTVYGDRCVIVGPWAPQGIELEERDVNVSGRKDAGFVLSVPL